MKRPRPRGRWFNTLKLRLMLASVMVIALSVTVSTLVVIERVEKRSEQAVMDPKRDHVEAWLAAAAACRSMQKCCGHGGHAAAGSTQRARRSHRLPGWQPALITNFAAVFLALPTANAGRARGTNSMHKPLNLRHREYFSHTWPRVCAGFGTDPAAFNEPICS